ncbi:AI-2E family transporter [Amycolatopsis acidicola]|uniref:AI-2E family transporter n=1 Tax=Amycolatopsis acidicola TaxID=2596893 RepID=UPI001FB5FC7B|nr:AI-2E family transporter [Amycolatopsis acidicola]
MAATNEESPEGKPAGLPRAVVVVGFLAGLVIVAAGISAVAWLVAPVFLALVLVITMYPVHGRLIARGVPRWLAVVLLLLAIYAVLAVLAGVVLWSIARLATVLPNYTEQANAKIAATLSTLRDLGIGPEELRTLVSTLDTGRAAGYVLSLLRSVTSVLGTLVFLLSLLLFQAIEAAGAAPRLRALREARPGLAAALGGFAVGTRRFLAVTSVIGMLTGAVDAVVLALLGVPLAPLWGLLVFICNYIPYLGFWLSIAPPAILGLLTGGWGVLIIVVVVFVVVNFVLTSLVQPKFVGTAVGVPVSVQLVALVFWTWLLGPVGAVLSVPLTLLVKALLVDADPRARWLSAFVGGRSL